MKSFVSNIEVWEDGVCLAVFSTTELQDTLDSYNINIHRVEDIFVFFLPLIELSNSEADNSTGKKNNTVLKSLKYSPQLPTAKFMGSGFCSFLAPKHWPP